MLRMKGEWIEMSMHELSLKEYVPPIYNEWYACVK